MDLYRRPNTRRKNKQILASTDDTATTINGAWVDTTDIEDASFLLVNADNTGGTLDCKIQGAQLGDKSDVYDIPSLGFTQQADGADLNQALPTAATREGIVLPRYVRAQVAIAAGVTSLDVKVYMSFARPRRGPVVDHGVIS
jgi:hypothetical protein